MKIAFDINGTLRRINQSETNTMIEFLKILKKAGNYIIVWSGDDAYEINKFVSDYGLNEYVDLAVSKLHIKPSDLPDIAFDDADFGYLGKIATIKV